MSEPPIVPLKDRVGPRTVNDIRGITPGMITMVAPLLNNLLDKGLKSGVFQTAKMEAALLAECAPNPVFAGTSSHKELDDICKEVCDHLQACFGLLRSIRQEDAKEHGSRRTLKTGGFRKKCTSGDWRTVLGLVERIEIGGTPSTTPPPSPRFHKESFNPNELDANGFPTIFGKALRGGASRATSADSVRSDTSMATKLYDIDGFPTLSESAPPSKSESVGELQLGETLYRPLADGVDSKPETPSRRIATPLLPAPTPAKPVLDEELKPVESTKKRKLAAKAQRAEQKIQARFARKKPVARKKPAAKVKSVRVASSCVDQQKIRRVVLAVARTAEVPRAELCGMVEGENGLRKIHLVTLSARSHGKSFEKDAIKLRDMVGGDPVALL